MEAFLGENFRRGFENQLQFFVVVTSCGFNAAGHGWADLGKSHLGCQSNHALSVSVSFCSQFEVAAKRTVS
jgi:hypothetical protein